MDYEPLQYEFKNSPTLKLLRSQNAALILSFLSKQFKETLIVEITQTELEEKLEDYLDFLREIHPDSYPRSARDYINDWCNDQLLRKTFNVSDDPVFTLTSAAEKAITWLEDLQSREEFVGAESRFLQIFDLLKEIQDRSTTDVETRIAQLEKDRDRFQQEIDDIRQSGRVERYDSTRLQERFIWANKVTRQLVSDFKEIEQNFRNLTRNVQEAQFAKDSRKGNVIGRVLDVDQELKDSDQGRSFYTFWHFLMSDRKRQELKSIIQTVYQLEELEPLAPQYSTLRRIERNLLNAGEYIVQSNHRLTEKLRQMLDERNLQENRRVVELMTEVQHLALQIAQYPPSEPDFWTLAGKPAVYLMMARPLHPLEESKVPTFSLDFSDVSAVVLDEEMAELYQQFYVDEDALVQQIAKSLVQESSLTLPELIELHPITQGLSEIVAYVAIATQSDRHTVDSSTMDTITITGLDPDTQLQLTLPHIIFYR
jgi:hypothetical protein